MHKTYKFLFLNLSIIFLFLGCTPPSAFSFFKKDELKASALQYTKVSKIVYEGQVKTTMNATYLNSVDDDFDDENQNFIIGIFISDENEKNFLDNDKYYITMNDRNASYSSQLSEQHKMYGHIPIYNNWADYYLIKFDTNESDVNLKLTLNHKEIQENNSTESSDENSDEVLYGSIKEAKIKVKTSSVQFEME